MSITSVAKSCIFKILPMHMYLMVLYFRYHKKKLNLKNPKDFSEKLFWLKIYYGEHEKKLIQQVFDKLTVREYVAHKIGESYLPKLYGSFDKVEDINFDKLPLKNVFKITQACGYNIINNDTSKHSGEEILKRLDKWLKESKDIKALNKTEREEHYYYNGAAKILCEELLENKDGTTIEDIRFYCFNGKAKFLSIDYESLTSDGEKTKEYKRNVFDLKGEYVPVEYGRPSDRALKLPRWENLAEMIEISNKLSQDFIFVRVDLYNIEGRVIFGELTPIPMGGAGTVIPQKYDTLWGSTSVCLKKIISDVLLNKKNGNQVKCLI